MNPKDRDDIKAQLTIIDRNVNGGSINHSEVTRAIQTIDERVCELTEEPKADRKGEKKPPEAGANFKLGDEPKLVTPPASNTPHTPVDVPRPQNAAPPPANPDLTAANPSG